jgi:hypothetical protein
MNGTQYNMLASTFDSAGEVTGTITLTGSKAHVMRNNIGFPNKNSDMGDVDTAFNTWDLTISEAATDFASTSDTGCTGPREADGSIPAACTFMHLAAGSPLIDKGKDVGLTFVGTAPDLGAYEYGAVTTGTGGNSGGSGGTTSNGGSINSGGSTGRGGSTGGGGSISSGGSMKTGGSVSSDGSVSSGGSIGRGGSGGSTISVARTGVGGASAAGTTEITGGTSGTGGSVSAATGGATATGGISGEGGAGQGSGGNTVAATGGTSNGSGAGTAGATGEGATGGATTGAAHGASGGGCAIGSRSPRDGTAAFLMLGVLALLVRRRQPGRPV